MNYISIDSVSLNTGDMDLAIKPFAALGVAVSNEGSGKSYALIGSGASPFRIDFQSITKESAGLVGVSLRVDDLVKARLALTKNGARIETDPATGHLIVAEADRAGVRLSLVGPSTRSLPFSNHSAADLRRLDHLAVITHDLEEKTRFWAEVLGIKHCGEIRTPQVVIRQLKIGDAIIELLGPVGADSPFAKRSAGLISMASFEVKDLEAAAVKLRSAGFAPTDSARGLIPETRIATLPADQTAGLSLQLLQYLPNYGPEFSSRPLA